MKKWMPTAGVLAALIFATQAHAGLLSTDGMDGKCPEVHSKAWCVWNVAKMSKGAPDIPQKSFRASYEKPGITAVDAGMAIATERAWLPPTGFNTTLL